MMKETQGNKATVSEYFRAVDRRLERIAAVEAEKLRISIAGRVLDINFFEKAAADFAVPRLQGAVTDAPGPADAEFFYWSDDMAPYLPAGTDGSPAVFRSADDTGAFHVLTSPGCLAGCDYARRRFYFCQDGARTGERRLQGHAMVDAFAMWARRSGLFMLHAACVGVEGRGVLIAGRGGTGKSTLAASCMLAGMDFISDDYTLITESGPLRAMPIYSMISVRDDMYKLLPPITERYLSHDDLYGKNQLDVSRRIFRGEMDIRAIVFPARSGGGEPSVVRTAPGPVLTRLIHSTAFQLGQRRSTELVRDLSARLSALPVYEMRVSPELMKNPAALSGFIKEEL